MIDRCWRHVAPKTQKIFGWNRALQITFNFVCHLGKRKLVFSHVTMCFNTCLSIFFCHQIVFCPLFYAKYTSLQFSPYAVILFVSKILDILKILLFTAVRLQLKRANYYVSLEVIQVLRCSVSKRKLRMHGTYNDSWETGTIRSTTKR